MAILLKDNDGISPLKQALKINSIPHVELLINALKDVVGDFNLSSLLYKDFPQLFKMKIKSFHLLLENCYF